MSPDGWWEERWATRSLQSETETVGLTHFIAGTSRLREPPRTHSRLFQGNETARLDNKFNVTKRALCLWVFSPLRDLIAEEN